MHADLVIEAGTFHMGVDSGARVSFAETHTLEVFVHSFLDDFAQRLFLEHKMSVRKGGR